MAYGEVFRLSDDKTRLPKSTLLESLTDEQRAAEDWCYDAAPVPLREVSKAIVPDDLPVDDEPISSSIVQPDQPEE
jgi:hypothetical protein